MPIVYLLLAGLAAGIISYQTESILSLGAGIGAGLVSTLLFAPLKKWRGPWFVFGILVGVGVAISARTQFRDPQDVKGWAPRECSSLEGIVEDLPSQKLNGKRSRVRFVLRAERFLYERLDCKGGELPSVDSLRIQKVSGMVQVFLVNPSQIPEPGDRVRIFGKLQRPQGVLNPGEMDYAGYLAVSRIDTIFSGIGPAALRLLEPEACLGLAARVQRFRGILARRFDRAFGEADFHAELLKALLLGLRSRFPQELWQVMMRTGTAHIISISGLHMSVLSAFIFMLLLLLLRSQKQAAVGSALALILYMFLAGGSIPVQRAALMGAAAYAGLWAEREVQPMRLLAWACFFQMIQNPLSIESISFQLSFLSVFILLLLRYLPPVHWLLEPFRATALVLAGTLPLAAWHFHMISWIALIANLWAIPFFNFALVSGAGVLALVDVPGVGWLAAKVCALCLDTGLLGLRFLSWWRQGWTTVAQPSFWKIAHYYAWAVGWFLATGGCADKVKPYFRHLLLVGWIAAGSFFWICTDVPGWSVTVLAGTRLPLIHMQVKKKHWLINAGQSSGGSDTRQRLMPYLKWRGIQRLDGIILTDYPKDVDLALSRLKDEVVLKKVYGPAPKAGQLPTFLSGQFKIPWQQTRAIRGLLLGPLKIQALSSGGKTKLIQITAASGAALFLITQLDTESMAMVERQRGRRTVLILYGPAAGHQPGVQSLRDRMRKRMRHAIWVFANENQSGAARHKRADPRARSYSLKKWGALQIRERLEPSSGAHSGGHNSGAIDLQFLSGARVTLI